MIRYETAADTLPRLTVEVAAVTMKNARALLKAGQPYLDGGEKIVNLAAVKEVDSAALAVLLEWQRKNRALAGKAAGKVADEGKTGTLRFSDAPVNLVTLAELYDLQEVMGLV
ncbi:MAG: STAS domain-containing protein [Betaproteobacteria bacterium]|nr:STAS domain-containing protein [Betaproteobacteria bacterium]